MVVFAAISQQCFTSTRPYIIQDIESGTRCWRDPNHRWEQYMQSVKMYTMDRVASGMKWESNATETCIHLPFRERCDQCHKDLFSWVPPLSIEGDTARQLDRLAIQETASDIESEHEMEHEYAVRDSQRKTSGRDCTGYDIENSTITDRSISDPPWWRNSICSWPRN